MSKKLYITYPLCLLTVFAILFIGLNSESLVNAQTEPHPQRSTSNVTFTSMEAALPFMGWLALDVDAYAQAAYQSELVLPPTTGDFTVELWVRDPHFETTILPVIARKDSLGLGFRYNVDYAPIPPVFSYRLCHSDSATWTGFGGILSNQPTSVWLCYDIKSCASWSSCPPTGWYHLAFVYNKTTGTEMIFWDGVFKGDASGSPLSSTNPLIISGGAAIDEVRISNNRRYSGLFTPPTAPFECDEHTLALWHFDEISGMTTFHDSCGLEDNLLIGYNGAHAEGVAGFKIYLPLVMRNDSSAPVSGISGKVSYDNSGVGNLTLNLMKYDGMSSSRNMTTTTLANGTYTFNGADSLNPGQFYYVRYWNSPSGGNTADSRYLNFWISRDITSTEGTNVPNVNFDIANVSLQSPAHGSSLPLPVAFQWAPRSIGSDYYQWSLMDTATFDDLCWGPHQTTGNFTLDTTGFSNCGLSYDVQYGWYAYVMSGTSWSDGYGKSYYYGTITLTTGLNQSGDLNDDAENSQSVIEPIVHYLK